MHSPKIVSLNLLKETAEKISMKISILVTGHTYINMISTVAAAKLELIMTLLMFPEQVTGLL